LHLTPQVSVIFLGCLEEFHVAVRREKSARVADGLHFCGTERLKAARDLEVLMQYAKESMPLTVAATGRLMA
jgi:hypothetical protein